VLSVRLFFLVELFAVGLVLTVVMYGVCIVLFPKPTESQFVLTPDQHRHKLAIATALRELEQALERFVTALSHEAGPVSVEAASSDREARRRVCDAYAAIDYGQEDEANRSPSCLGVAGVSAALIDRADAVNEVKARLKAVCAPLQDARVRVPVKDGQGGRVVKALPLVRVILRELSRSDLNLLAAYRKIPVLTGRVQRVVYTRALTRAVYRKHRNDLAAMLTASNRPSAAEDLERLRRLPASETHLAFVKDRYTNIRANVWFDGLDARSRGRVLIVAELPLLYPRGRSTELPEIRYPDPESAERTTPIVRTGKLEPEPLLESLPVYRYRPTPRRGQRHRP